MAVKALVCKFSREVEVDADDALTLVERVDTTRPVDTEYILTLDPEMVKRYLTFREPRQLWDAAKKKSRPHLPSGVQTTGCVDTFPSASCAQVHVRCKPDGSIAATAFATVVREGSVAAAAC